MVMLMMWSVWPLLIESALILLQTVPTHIDIEKLKRKLLENIDGILAVSFLVIVTSVVVGIRRKRPQGVKDKLMHIYRI